MKKIYILISLATILFATSCSKDTTSTIDTLPTRKVTLNVTLDDTRTALGDKVGGAYKIVWSEGDQIAMNGVASNALTAAEAGGSTANFTADIAGETLNVFYPAAFVSTTDHGATAIIPREQAYVAGSFAQGSAILMGHGTVAERDLIKFNNACGFLRLTLSPDEAMTFKGVTLRSRNGEALSGEFAVDYENGILTAVMGRSSSIARVVSTEAMATDSNNNTDVIIAVPAGTYVGGIWARVVRTDSQFLDRQTSSDLTIEAGHIYNMATMPTPDVKFESYTIADADDLQEFIADVNSGIAIDCKVVLANDIDLTGVTLSSAETFSGEFDGNGKSLLNWTSDGVCLFETLQAGGIVKGVILDSTCDLTFPPKTTKEFGFLVANNYGTVEQCKNSADIVWTGDGSAMQRGTLIGNTFSGATVTNCENEGNITLTISGHNEDTMHIGGVQGRSQDVGTQTYNCINRGTIHVIFKEANDTIATTKNIYLGGVSGASNTGSTMEECKNYGTIEILAKNKGFGAASCFGGVTGYSGASIRNCYNEGDITVQSDLEEDGDKRGYVKGCVVGGITAYVDGAATGCTNKGNLSVYCGTFVGRNSIGGITSDKSYSSAAPCMGGVIGYGYRSTVTDCHNHGKITYHQIASNAPAATYSGRHAFGGIIGAPQGNITGCNNYGEMDIQLLSIDRSAVDRNIMPIVGGISGGDYYPKGQNKTNITNCTNEGNISIECDGFKSYCAFGGIVGWPGVEGSEQTTLRKDCTNKGAITLKGKGKFRTGGIQGGSGNVDHCINRGAITQSGGCKTATSLGGISGFHSNGHKMIRCENYGKIKTSSKITNGAGGLVGFFGNAATTISNCKVKCTVQGHDDGGNVGMLVGHFSGTTETISVGEEGAEMQVLGKLVRLGTTTNIAAEHLTKEYMFGQHANSNIDTHLLFVTLLQ